MPVPVDEALQKLQRCERADFYTALVRCFGAAYPGRPLDIVRAPGRLNIIGEHTDYNGLPVMPMAIDREMAIALTPADDARVEMSNLDDAYPPFSFELSAQIEPASAGHWSNYARAAGQALWDWAQENSPESLPLRGFAGCAGGTVPAGSGLSSSSALVVAAACALVHVNRLPIERPELADLLARGERYVGTQGGGMDQAASLLSREGTALKIDFFPLRTRQVRLTQDTRIVNSRFFGNDPSQVPETALSVGVGTVTDADEVLIIVNGANKARALRHAIEEGINHMWTISALQTHPNGIIVCDEDATLELKVGTARYFKDVEAATLDPASLLA